MTKFTFPIVIHATASIEGDIEAECWNTVGRDIKAALADPEECTVETENGGTMTFTGFNRGNTVKGLVDALNYLLEMTVDADLAVGIELTQGEVEAREQALAAIANAMGEM